MYCNIDVGGLKGQNLQHACIWPWYHSEWLERANLQACSSISQKGGWKGKHTVACSGTELQVLFSVGKTAL